MFLTTFKDICMVHLIDMGIPYSFSFNYYLLKKTNNPKPLFYQSLPHGKHEKKKIEKKKKKNRS